MSTSPSPTPGFISGQSYNIDIPAYDCPRYGYINCYNLDKAEEKCYDATSSELSYPSYFCSNVLPDKVHRYSKLGGGGQTSAGVFCPHGDFMSVIENVGDKKEISW